MTPTLLPPLPLNDGALFIDNSALELLCTCPRAFLYSYIYKRRIADASNALSFGGCIHAALEYRYRHCPDLPTGQCESAQLNLIAKWFTDHPAMGEDHRTQELATKIITHYNKKYQVEPFSVLVAPTDLPNGLRKGDTLVELSFAFKLTTILINQTPTDVYYMGRIDLPVEWSEGGVFVIDHKTAYMLGTGFFEEQAMNPQHVGYCWAYWKCTGIIPRGYVVNAIRVRPPAATRAAVIDDDFQRQRYFITPERLQEWETNVTALVEEAAWNYTRSYFPMKQKWCYGKYGRCQYFDVCTLPMASRNVMLSSNLYTDNEWSPLTKTKK